MQLADLGWDERWRRAFAAATAGDNADDAAPRLSDRLCPGRVAVEYQDRLTVWTEDGPVEAMLSGRLRGARVQQERPAVGDWVMVERHDARGATVRGTLPRRTVLLRRAAGEVERAQVVIANVDVVAVMTSPTPEFSARRVERYLSAIAQGGARAVVVLGKADLAPERATWLASLAEAAGSSPVVAVSVRTGEGVAALGSAVRHGETLALVGSSGVGKSSLINALTSGTSELAVGAVRDGDAKGRHTTRNRVLVRLPTGGVLVDTPGMREFQPWDASPEAAFNEIVEQAAACRFADCSHRDEPDCAVRASVERGEIARPRYDSYLKLAAGAAGRVRRGRR